MRPLLIDAFCAAGGAAMGYHRAGFEVVGVDINPQPRYPFEFHRGDALEFVRENARRAAVIHGSPPCHDWVALRAQIQLDGTAHLLPEFRALVESTGVPYVIENVMPAPLRADAVLCGLMFGLRVFRHRKFESNMPIAVPNHPSHSGHRVAGWRHGVRHDGNMFAVYGSGGGKGTRREWAGAMGIDWMTKAEMALAIPPVYTEHIGHQLMAHISSQAAA